MVKRKFGKVSKSLKIYVHDCRHFTQKAIKKTEQCLQPSIHHLSITFFKLINCVYIWQLVTFVRLWICIPYLLNVIFVFSRLELQVDSTKQGNHRYSHMRTFQSWCHLTKIPSCNISCTVCLRSLLTFLPGGSKTFGKTLNILEKL